MGKLLQMPLLFEALLEEDFKIPTSIDTAEPAGPTLADSASLSEDVADAAERRLALDHRRSWIVEAPAGSGKTGLLIQRFLKLLAYGDVEQPDEVLAITFTRKADAEMRRRVLEQLAAAKQGAELPPNAGPFEINTRQLAEAALARDAALNWNLIGNPRQLNIRTIDSFCAELACSMPLLAGAGGRYSPTDDPEPLYDLAAELTLLRMGGDDPVLSRDLEELLLHRDAQPGDFKRLLADMLKQREQWGELLPLNSDALTDKALDEEVRPRLTRTLHRLIAQELEAVVDLVGQDLLQRLAALAHTLSTCPGYKGEASPIALCEGLAHAPAASAEALPHWRCLVNLVHGQEDWRVKFTKNIVRFEASPEEQQSLQYLVAEFRERAEHHPDLQQAFVGIRTLPDPNYPDDQWRVVKSLCRVLRHGLVELQTVFSERRTCDFSEVALNARSLIRSEVTASDLLNTSVGRLRHLLVDEMQDTSASQYELLETLTSTWDGSSQTLFLVGDPKQSIYEFRQARVERFRRVMDLRRFGQLTVDPLRLTANFRSQANLVADFNGTFSQILPSPDDPALAHDSVDVPFIAATATRPGTHPQALQWHFSEDPTSAPPGADDDEAEPNSTNLEKKGSAPTSARQIRVLIESFFRDWNTRPLEPGRARRPAKVAVLARNRSHLAPVIQEFHQDHGDGRLHFRAVDVEALNERPEILDLLALTRALLHPADRVAWLALLRSPMCGLALDDLLALTGDGPEADLQATVPFLISARTQLLSPEGQQVLEQTWPILTQAREGLGRTSFSTHLERTWRSLGGDAPLQEHERMNAGRFLDLLHRLETGPEPFSLGLITRRLRSLYAEPSQPDAPVELMTIHKAKGLEWDLVLIPALHRLSGRNSHEFLKWLEFDNDSGTPDILLAPIQSKGEDIPQLSTWLNRRQSRREAAETKRLFYVGCTRAREALHLFATVKRRRDGALEEPRDSTLLKAAWPAAKDTATQQLEQAGGADNVIAFAQPEAEPVSLALAASAEDTPDGKPTNTADGPLRRLPLSFDRMARFNRNESLTLPYMPASSLRIAAPFARPEGSFAARAFGNAVHRFLYLLSMHMAEGQPVAALRQELPSWHTRLLATLRAEGLAPAQAGKEADRALAALTAALDDPYGSWLLGPQHQARSESPVPSLSTEDVRTSFRADRSFQAGPVPLSTGDTSHLWIVDYKTAELGGRSRERFLDDQRAKYEPQMHAYAESAVQVGHAEDRIVLALYFPFLPALHSWLFRG